MDDFKNTQLDFPASEADELKKYIKRKFESVKKI